MERAVRCQLRGYPPTSSRLNISSLHISPYHPHYSGRHRSPNCHSIQKTQCDTHTPGSGSSDRHINLQHYTKGGKQHRYQISITFTFPTAQSENISHHICRQPKIAKIPHEYTHRFVREGIRLLVHRAQYCLVLGVICDSSFRTFRSTRSIGIGFWSGGRVVEERVGHE